MSALSLQHALLQGSASASEQQQACTPSSSSATPAMGVTAQVDGNRVGVGGQHAPYLQVT